MHRFFVPRQGIQYGRAMMAGPELRHLRRVLRLQPGETVVLFDDEGWEHQGIIRRYGAQAAEIEILRSYRPGRESMLDITLAQALGKGDKMDLVVEKATELGVRALAPFLSAYTIPKVDGRKIEMRRARWQRIALSAVKQSGRTRIPELLELSDFNTLVRRPWPCELKLLVWEKESARGLAQIREERSHAGSVLLVIGPEGGFSEEEAAEATAHGFQSVRLGTRILRTETAALAAVSLAQFLWGDMG